MTRDEHVAAHGDGAIFTHDWTGPRFRYGYCNRPFAMAHQPPGFIIGSLEGAVRIPEARVRWGTIEYPFQLSGEEVYRFELSFLGEVKP
jgi:hypothetical protein